MHSYIIFVTMDQEKYNLNWDTYSDHLRQMLHNMLKSTELTDVTLICDDKKQLEAHKIVLSACSSVFRTIINDLPKKSSVIYLRGIKSQDMESILEFMYLGVATLYHERINDFVKVAKDLEITDISKNEQYLIKNRDILDKSNLYTEEDTQMVIPCNSGVQDNSETDHNNLRQKHKVSYKICSTCDFQTNSSAVLKEHKRKHTGEKPLVCKWCDIGFRQKKTLQNHERLHTGEKPFQCKECDKKFAQRTSLNVHTQNHHKITDE